MAYTEEYSDLDVVFTVRKGSAPEAPHAAVPDTGDAGQPSRKRQRTEEGAGEGEGHDERHNGPITLKEPSAGDVPPPDAAEGTGTVVVVDVLPAHCIVLQARSEHFHAMLKKKVEHRNRQQEEALQQEQEAVSGQLPPQEALNALIEANKRFKLPKLQLNEECESEEEVLWAKACIKAMYADAVLPTSEAFEAVPEDDKVTVVAKVTSWAARFLSSHVLRLCLHWLKDRASKELMSVRDLNIVLQELPARAQTVMTEGMEEFNAVKAACADSVSRRFEDATEIMKGPGKKAFCSLCPAAVLLWVQSDSVKAAREEDIVWLITVWLEHKQGKDLMLAWQGQRGECEKKDAADVLAALSKAVRVGQLNPFVRGDIIPRLLWFDPCLGLELARFIHFAQQGRVPEDVGFPAWRASARPVGRRRHSACVWRFSREALQTTRSRALENGSTEAISNVFYLSGMIYETKLTISGDASVSLRLLPGGRGLIPAPLRVRAHVKAWHVTPEGEDTLYASSYGRPDTLIRDGILLWSGEMDELELMNDHLVLRIYVSDC